MDSQLHDLIQTLFAILLIVGVFLVTVTGV